MVVAIREAGTTGESASRGPGLAQGLRSTSRTVGTSPAARGWAGEIFSTLRQCCPLQACGRHRCWWRSRCSWVRPWWPSPFRPRDCLWGGRLRRKCGGAHRVSQHAREQNHLASVGGGPPWGMGAPLGPVDPWSFIIPCPEPDPPSCIERWPAAPWSCIVPAPVAPPFGGDDEVAGGHPTSARLAATPAAMDSVRSAVMALSNCLTMFWNP